MTPSGDDFLVGFMAGLVLLGLDEQARSLGSRILGLIERTTRPGATILAQAAQYQFPGYLRAAADAVAAGEIDAAVAIGTHHGATSGLDALAGLALALARAGNSASAQT
jgi:hypothetical protein